MFIEQGAKDTLHQNGEYAGKFALLLLASLLKTEIVVCFVTNINNILFLSHPPIFCRERSSVSDGKIYLKLSGAHYEPIKYFKVTNLNRTLTQQTAQSPVTKQRRVIRTDRNTQVNDLKKKIDHIITESLPNVIEVSNFISDLAIINPNSGFTAYNDPEQCIVFFKVNHI